MKLGKVSELKGISTVLDHRSRTLLVAAKLLRMPWRLRRLAVLRRLHELATHDEIHAAAVELGYASTTLVPLVKLVGLLRQWE